MIAAVLWHVHRQAALGCWISRQQSVHCLTVYRLEYFSHRQVKHRWTPSTALVSADTSFWQVCPHYFILLFRYSSSLKYWPRSSTIDSWMSLCSESVVRCWLSEQVPRCQNTWITTWNGCWTDHSARYLDMGKHGKANYPLTIYLEDCLLQTVSILADNNHKSPHSHPDCSNRASMTTSSDATISFWLHSRDQRRPRMSFWDEIRIASLAIDHSFA